MYIAHLGRRFVGALSNAEPSPCDTQWATAQLTAAEGVLWSRMNAPDRRHAVVVARCVVENLGGQAPSWAAAAALLHDVGKVTSGLGTWTRVVATLVPRLWCRGRFAEYKRHDAIGAELLRASNSHKYVVAWAGQHHWPPQMWTVPIAIAAVLKSCDDD